MNDRILALIAFILVFARLWSTEHQHRADLVVRLQKTRVLAAHDSGPGTCQKVNSIAVDRDAPSPRSEPENSVLSLPVPKDIQPGWYRVLNSLGRTSLVEITTAQLGPEKAVCGRPPRDFYVTVVGDRHWIFETIRTPVGHPSPEVKPSLTLTDSPDFSQTAYPTGDCLETHFVLKNLPSRNQLIVKPPALPVVLIHQEFHYGGTEGTEQTT